MTKYDTILWINHAIAYFSSIDKKQKDLAAQLGIEETRLSEMKRGKGSLSPNLMKKISDLCGAPRRKPGRFEYAEVYSCFESFTSNFTNITNNRFMRGLVDLFQDKNNQDQLTKFCYVLDADNRNANSATLSDINDLLRNEEFSKVCTKYLIWLRDYEKASSRTWEGWSNENSSVDFTPILRIGQINIRDKSVFNALFRLWLLVSNCPEFQFGEPLNLQPVVPLSSIILTGQKVLVFSNCIQRSVVGGIDRLALNEGHVAKFGYPYGYPRDWVQDEFYINFNEFGQPIEWKEVRCELYLSENMNYHLVVHLSQSGIQSYPDWDKYGSSAEFMDKTTYVTTVCPESDRLAVIENINSLDLFRVVEEARKWCGLPKDNLFELKRKIALSGGHVPGARLLT